MIIVGAFNKYMGKEGRREGKNKGKMGGKQREGRKDTLMCELNIYIPYFY